MRNSRVGALLSLLRSEYKQHPGRYVIGRKRKVSSGVGSGSGGGNVLMDPSTSGNEIHVVGRTLLERLSTNTTITGGGSGINSNINNNSNSNASASGIATLTRSAIGSTGTTYRSRSSSLMADNNDDYIRSYASNNNNNNNNNVSSITTTTTTTTTTGREVIFPDSFEVLPQPRDLNLVYMDIPHEQQRKFRCRFCGKGYRWKSTMRRHEMVECGGKPPAFQCPDCPYKARQRGYWTQMYAEPTMNNATTTFIGQGQLMTIGSTNIVGNQRTSNYQPYRLGRGQSSYKCPNCDRYYMRTSCLKRHLRVECGQKPQYQCHICQGWFKYKHNLSAHMKIHMEEPKHHCSLYGCRSCGKEYSTPGSFKYHKNVECSKEPRFACTYCIYKSTRKSNLHRHMKIHWQTRNVNDI
ncbi:PREDICTED: zinc finger protein 468-like [Polistes dominula]|uniref:Zinc finger protein 468-like n=1 Tax=Polistes dominula TaxID=743375 RepID=A0ABM1IEF6_POLDO|nr:PREDICTED: zinc finger protein 468-like [Polistes dominula]